MQSAARVRMFLESLMPQGLETRLSHDELRDLLAYMQSLKRLTSFAAEGAR